MEGADQMWTYLWQQIKSSRQRKLHNIDIPRLRSFDVVGGSYRPVSEISQWEAAAQQRLQVNISERDDEARRGIASVKCTELEALKSILGPKGPFRNHQQELLMDAVRTRADKGPFIRRVPPVLMDQEMMRPSPFWDRLDERRFYYR